MPGRGFEKDRSKIRGAALAVIRTILEKPDFDKIKKSQLRNDWLAPPHLSFFKNLEPLGFGLAKDDWWVFPPEDCTPDVVWPLSVGFVCEEPNLCMTRYRTVATKEVRGYASRYSPFMVRADHAQMDCGQLMRAAGLYAWIGGNWTDAENRVIYKGAIPTRSEIPPEDKTHIRLATAIALRQRYEWAVSLGLDHSPSIRFDTDPTGVKDIFRIRDLPDGKDRREALLTWVTDHWRQDRHDPEMEVYVRKHLRGAATFSWRSMNCEILPSQFDMDKRNELADIRADMSPQASKRRRQA